MSKQNFLVREVFSCILRQCIFEQNRRKACVLTRAPQIRCQARHSSGYRKLRKIQ